MRERIRMNLVILLSVIVVVCAGFICWRLIPAFQNSAIMQLIDTAVNEAGNAEAFYEIWDTVFYLAIGLLAGGLLILIGMTGARIRKISRRDEEFPN